MSGLPRDCSVFGVWGCMLVLSSFALACGSHDAGTKPSLVFDRVPPAATGGAGETDKLSGKVLNAPAGARVVVYVHSGGTWYVQPLTIHPFTQIGSDGSWSASTHLGAEYAALLVKADYRPANTLSALPPSNSVLALKAAAGDPASVEPARIVHFSGYDWTVRQLGSDRYGAPHAYTAANVEVDDKGWLHLHVRKIGNEWTCSEVALPRSLGYGRYILSMESSANFEPATAFDMFTWDQSGTDRDRREVDAEVTRWGDPDGKNAEYAVQPYFRPTNAYRYSVPAVPLTFTMLWESGKVRFITAQSRDKGLAKSAIANHVFVEDIPSPQTESIRINLCTFDYGKVKQTADTEAVVKDFRYLP